MKQGLDPSERALRGLLMPIAARRMVPTQPVVALDPAPGDATPAATAGARDGRSPCPPEPARTRPGSRRGPPDASAPSSIAVTIGSNITLPWVFAQVTVDVDRGEVLLA